MSQNSWLTSTAAKTRHSSEVPQQVNIDPVQIRIKFTSEKQQWFCKTFSKSIYCVCSNLIYFEWSLITWAQIWVVNLKTAGYWKTERLLWKWNCNSLRLQENFCWLPHTIHGLTLKFSNWIFTEINHINQKVTITLLNWK